MIFSVINLGIIAVGKGTFSVINFGIIAVGKGIFSVINLGIIAVGKAGDILSYQLWHHCSR